ncbi:DJ-1/PfpI family protein [Ideonella paludis]|uniref:DJ-1/PfpI family protein n=1 Tax=Ideonella paludis TaxID=1233411 RepID=A0ABS5DS45_9BURK|nr:DJ-1/PfpI family protein [Ideonella paludis]MBQ0933949.1 DJ-1/PfpI family protein [Ideonella paludis]
MLFGHPLISVRTGVFVLHAAGCLEGKRATTHCGSLQRLRELGDVAVVEERWVRDGAVWTSAGVAAGMDVILAVIADVAGDEVAGRVQFASEYYPAPRRYGNFMDHPGMPAYARSGAGSAS